MLTNFPLKKMRSSLIYYWIHYNQSAFLLFIFSDNSLVSIYTVGGGDRYCVADVSCLITNPKDAALGSSQDTQSWFQRAWIPLMIYHLGRGWEFRGIK